MCFFRPRMREMYFVISIVLLWSQVESIKIYVSPNGTDNKFCWLGGELFPCNTLNFALRGATEKNVTLMLNGEYYLLDNNHISTHTLFIRRDAFLMIGTNQKMVTVTCNGTSGLSFFTSRYIELKNIKFNGCSLHVDVPSNTSVALLFSGCVDIVLDNVVVSHTNGTGVVVLEPTGSVYIYNTSILENTNGGLKILDYSSRKYCFIFNSSAWKSCGDGEVKIVIRETTFKNNRGINGAGMLINISNNTYNVLINHSYFFNNKAMGFGGGLAITQQTYIKDSLKLGKSQSMFILSYCIITNNTALTGAGMAVRLTDKYILTQCQKKYCFQFQNCIFNKNKGQRGAAIHSMLVTTLDSPHTLHDICVMAFLNCSFRRNNISHVSNQPTIVSEYGTIVAFHMPLCFKEYNQFEYNNASALSVGATVVTLNGVMKFSNNSGMNGGGIAVYDGGSIVIEKGLQAFFADNRAINKGPALYFSHVVPRYNGGCFLRYIDMFVNPDEWEYGMEFINNSISSGINGSIYVSSLNACQFQFPNQSFSLFHIFCSDSWSYKESNCTEQIITGPASIRNYTTYTVIPGTLSLIPISIFDELNRNTTEITTIVGVSDGHHTYTDFANHTQASTLFTNPWYQSFMPKKTQTNETIQLWTVADQTVTLSNLFVKMRHCPPGFYHAGSPPNGAGYCTCVQNQPFMICLSTLFSKNAEIYLKQGWFMTYDEVNNDVYVATQQLYQPIPLEGHDNKDGFITLKLDISLLNNFTCGHLKRDGVLCSKCTNDTSVSVTTYDFQCVECKQEYLWKRILFYLFLQLVPAFLFCTLLTVFNFSITSGPMNAFGMFSQIISNPLLVTHLQYQFNQLHSGNVLFNFIIIPYGFWNLDFFKTVIPPFCLSPNTTNIEAWTLQYVSAVLPLTFILILYIFTELCACGCRPIVQLALPVYRCIGQLRRRWHFQTNLINTFATLFLLSYTKLCAVSIFLLISTKAYVYHNDSSAIPSVESIVYLQPDYGYFKGGHLPYAIIALFVLVFFVLLPPILLILHSCNVCRCRYCNLFIKSFTDIFEGCYKDGSSNEKEKDYRYFSGIHLLLRFVVLLLINFQYSDDIRYLLLPLLMATFVMAMSYLQPYKLGWVNLVDSIFFAILISVIMTFAPLSASYQPLGNSVVLVVTMWSLTTIPLFYFFGYCVFNIYKKIQTCRLSQKVSRTRSRQQEDDLPYRLLHSSEDSED